METRVTLPGQRQHSVGSPGDSTFPPQDLLYIFILYPYAATLSNRNSQYQNDQKLIMSMTHLGPR